MSRLWSVLLLALSLAAVLGGAWMLCQKPPRIGAHAEGRDGGPVTASPSNQKEEGELQFQTREIDLGIVKEATQCEFRYANRSSQTIRLLHIKPSCNCTATIPDKRVLEPGESGCITIKVNPRQEQVGRHAYAVDLEYQGSRLHQTRLRLLFQNYPEVVVPERVSLRSLPGKTATARFVLIDYRDRPLKINTITTSSPNLQARVVEESSSYLPGWHFAVEVSCANKDFAPGASTETIVLRTTDLARETILVHAVIERVHRVRAAPSTLYLTAAQDNSEAQTGKIYYDDTEGELLDFQSITPSHESLRCVAESGSSPTRRIVRVDLDAGRLPANHPPLLVRVMFRSPVAEELCITVVPRGSP